MCFPTCFQLQKDDNSSIKSSSGVSSAPSEQKRNSYFYDANDTVELRIVEENEKDDNATIAQAANTALLNFNNHQRYLLSRQDSHQSISVILDNIWDRPFNGPTTFLDFPGDFLLASEDEESSSGGVRSGPSKLRWWRPRKIQLRLKNIRVQNFRQWFEFQANTIRFRNSNDGFKKFNG